MTEIFEYLIIVMHNAAAFTLCMKNIHQFFILAAEAFIRITKLLNIFLLQAREVAVQSIIEILSVALTKGGAYSKTNNAFHIGAEAQPQDTEEIFLGIINIRKNRRKPYYGEMCIRDRTASWTRFIQGNSGT